jgi:F-type H+-transporting ATPase subunit a
MDDHGVGQAAETTAAGHEIATTAAEHASESGIHLSLAAERIGSIFGIPITNTLLTSWIVMALLIGIAFIVGRRLTMVPGRFQTLVESFISYVHDYSAEILEHKERARKFLPLLLTVFLFIFTSNVLEFTPGIGSIYVDHEGVHAPLLRSVNTDLNVTLALSIIAVVVIEIAGIVALGFFRYSSKFINFRSVTGFFVGLIELVSEISRLVSFSFRLFGNIFAGEVLIAVVIFFAPYVIPVPLMAFEMFIGFIQAVVFAMLILFFVKLAMVDPHEAH